jgi:hypothetical protein
VGRQSHCKDKDFRSAFKNIINDVNTERKREMSSYDLKHIITAIVILLCMPVIGCSSDDSDQDDEKRMVYTFENGTEGWVAGFSDLPADADPELYELESSHQKLPSGLAGYGIYIQGSNRSDDLLMFLKTQVGGLQPNATYRVDFSIDLATNVPAGLVGVGGAPGEDVTVKAGAVAHEPQTATDNLGWLRLNIDHGSQSNGGEEMIVIGNAVGMSAHFPLEDDDFASRKTFPQMVVGPAIAEPEFKHRALLVADRTRRQVQAGALCFEAANETVKTAQTNIPTPFPARVFCPYDR